MGIFAEYFTGASYLTLAEAPTRESRPKTVSKKSSNRNNVKEVIQDLYEHDWFTFSSVNVISNLYSKPRFKIESTPSGVKIWENFFDNMREYGNNTSLKRLRADIKRDCVKFGKGYVELVPSSDGSEILDLKRVDAAFLSHARDRLNDLVLDEYGKSVGYIMNLGRNSDTEGKSDPIPPRYEGIIPMNKGDIFISPHRIVEFSLYRLGNGIDSIGIIEPAIVQAQRRKRVEDAQVNAIWIRGTAPLFALVGDSTHEPNPQMLSDAADSLEEMKNSSVAAFAYYQEPKTLDAKIDDISTKIMNYLMSAEAGAANVPMPFVTGAGEATNRSTLKSQREMLEVNMQEKIDNFDEDWNLLIMDRISKFNSFPPAKIVSEELRLESKDEIAKRLAIYAGIGSTLGTPVLSAKEFRDAIKSNENIKVDDKEYTKFIKSNPQSTQNTQQIQKISDNSTSLLTK